MKAEWWKSSAKSEWATPQWLFDRLNDEFHFETDVCASDANHKCARYFTREQDGLTQEWRGACWLNPPYGRTGGNIYDWMEKAHAAAKQGATVVCLIPARTDTKWWWDFVIHGEVRFIQGRLSFNESGPATFPSAVVVFYPGVPVMAEGVFWWLSKEQFVGADLRSSSNVV